MSPEPKYCAICLGAPGTFVCGLCFSLCGVKTSAVDAESQVVKDQQTFGRDLGEATHREGVDLDDAARQPWTRKVAVHQLAKK